MDYVLTFLEGIITFVSPCLLPLLPLYVAYFAGGTVGAEAKETNAGESSSRTWQTLASALGFVLGFGIVFTLMGAFAGRIGSLLIAHRRVIDVVCGVLIVLMGANYLGILRIGLFDRTVRMNTNVRPRGFASSLVFGVVFALGWTPCVGAFLSSALSLAATSGNTVRGVALLACYSLGLGLPFVVSAVLLDQLEGAFAWVRQHYEVVNRLCGVLLIAMGVLMATGHLGALLGMLAG